MTTLSNIQQYCNNKKIIIVGNSDCLFDKPNGSLIDSYDIVVRINWGAMSSFKKQYTGYKTNIFSSGVNNLIPFKSVLRSKINYVLYPVYYSKATPTDNSFKVDLVTYQELKSNLDNTKPSTGICTFNFLNKYTEPSKLDLIGFDFFKTSRKKRNLLGHFKVQDHNGELERIFFNKSKNSNLTNLI